MLRGIGKLIECHLRAVLLYRLLPRMKEQMKDLAEQFAASSAKVLQLEEQIASDLEEEAELHKTIEEVRHEINLIKAGIIKHDELIRRNGNTYKVR